MTTNEEEGRAKDYTHETAYYQHYHKTKKECDHFWAVYKTRETGYRDENYRDYKEQTVIKVFCQKCLEKREI